MFQWNVHVNIAIGEVSKRFYTRLQIYLQTGVVACFPIVITMRIDTRLLDSLGVSVVSFYVHLNTNK